jgi:hypothetical protein
MQLINMRKKKIIIVKTFKVKAHENDLILFGSFSFFDVVPSGTTQGYFHPSKYSMNLIF